MVDNTWNDRAAQGRARPKDPFRPWYHYGLQLLMKHTPDADQKLVLDVGCGVGEFLEMLQARHFAVAGVDGNADQIEQVKKNGIRAEVADLEKALPFEDESFDVVVCLEVIEHVARAEFLLQEFRRILKHDGLLLLTTPNFAFIKWRIGYLFGAGPTKEGIHMRHFTRKLLTERLARAGFTIVDRNSFGPVPILNSIAGRVFRHPLVVWGVGNRLETLLAFDFVYLARKQ
jgi:methionine biosynthesis protein MetW